MLDFHQAVRLLKRELERLREPLAGARGRAREFGDINGINDGINAVRLIALHNNLLAERM